MDPFRRPAALTGMELAGRYAPLDGSDFQAMAVAILRQCAEESHRAGPAARDGDPLPGTDPRQPAQR